MTNTNLQIKVTAKRKILKFAEGSNPETDEPFEVIELEEIYTGDQAIQIADQYGIFNAEHANQSIKIKDGGHKDGSDK
jgi:hypothetical protein